MHIKSENLKKIEELTEKLFPADNDQIVKDLEKIKCMLNLTSIDAVSKELDNLIEFYKKST